MGLNPIEILSSWQMTEIDYIFFNNENISIEFLQKELKENKKYKEIIIKACVQNRNPNQNYQDLEWEVYEIYKNTTLEEALEDIIDIYYYSFDLFDDSEFDEEDKITEEQIEEDYAILDIHKITLID